MGGRGSKSPKVTSQNAKARNMAGGGAPNGNTDDGTYKPWYPGETLSDARRDFIMSDWISHSGNVRHAVQGRPNSGAPFSQKEGQMYDDWLCSGSYNKTIYRGKKVTMEDYNAIMKLKPGDVTDQNGPASFSKSESRARSFAGGMYAPPDAKRRVVYVLENGSNCCQDLTALGHSSYELEVTVGSASSMVVTKAPETKVVGGLHYTYIYGYELKTQYVPSHGNNQ